MKKRKKRKKRKIRKKSRVKTRKNIISRKLKKRSKTRKKLKKQKKTKIFSRKIDIETLLTSLKIKFNFNFRELITKIISPIVKGVKDYKKNRVRIELKNKKASEKQKKQEASLREELLKKEIKEEKILAKTRAAELKSFLREEQKNIREKEKEKQRKFLEEIKLEKTLERFRDRELEEIKAIEKYALDIEKEDYKNFQTRIDLVKDKYRALRNERLRKRVEELGVELSDQATIEEIRQKEKDYIERRELIETSLDSFVRSSTSLIYQINKRYLPRNADLIRVINLVYEQSEIIIREDQEQNENYLILIYVKDQDVKRGLIVVEDKIKQQTREYNRGQIFKYGDDLTDSMIEYLERIRERTKKAS